MALAYILDFRPNYQNIHFRVAETSRKAVLLVKRERSYNVNNSIAVVNPSSSMNTVPALDSIRFDIWEYFKIHCLSFQRMDCNAQFS